MSILAIFLGILKIQNLASLRGSLKTGHQLDLNGIFMK